MKKTNEYRLTKQQEKEILVYKVKEGEYLSDEEMRKLKNFASEDESQYDNLFDFNPEGIVEKAEMIKKIKEGKHLSEEELEKLAFCSDIRGDLFFNNLSEVIARDDTRWYKNMTTVLKFDGELYAIDWRKGLTELQENAFYEQPYKVKKIKRVITITDYKPIEEKGS